MKKICFVIPRAYYLFNPDAKDSKDKVGGAQKQAYILSTALANDDIFDVNFCVADFGQTNFEELKGVKLWKTFNFSDNIFKRIFQLCRTLKKINADTYIFRSADTGVAFAICFINFFLKKKTLYMIAADAETTKKLQKTHNGILTAFTMSYVYKNADIITAQTTQQYEIFTKYRKRKPDAIIKNIFSNKKTTNINHNGKNINLWVGRLSEIKNPELFLNLAKKYPSEKFVMIAPIVLEKQEYGRKIRIKAEKILNLQYVDYVKPSEIIDFYRKAKTYILTSDSEGFSNTMAEAMMQECAILSYNVNPDNILNNYKCGFCADADTEKFISYFKRLIKDENLRKYFGINGAKYILENHKKEIITEKFKSLL